MALSMLLCAAGCSVTRSVRPAGRGAVVVGASVGGPFVGKFGVPTPLPLGVVYGRVGVGDRTDLDVGLMLPTVRAASLDVGASHLVLGARGWRPAVMVGGRLIFSGSAAWLVGRAERGGPALRLLEEAHVTASWLSGRWHPYLGASLFAQAERLRAVPSVVAGAEWHISRRWRASAEGKWVAFTARPDGGAADWLGIGGHGALALQLGAAYRFGGAPF